MMKAHQNIAILLVLANLAVLAACNKTQAEKPPERVTVITAATIRQKDLPVTESAVGSTTVLGAAEALDPNQMRRGSFTIRLPFPDRVARQLRIGQSIRLSSFDQPDKNATAYIKQIRPALDSTTQSMEVIAELPGGREWYSMGSVRGEVVLGVHQRALVVPEHAVVLRPAGSVVYVVNGDTVSERVVTTGILRDGEIEILSGLKPGETVTVDGAAQLSDGIKVRLRDAASAAAGGEGRATP